MFQEGAQKIIGFDFSASLVMDMKEVNERTVVVVVSGGEKS